MSNVPLSFHLFKNIFPGFLDIYHSTTFCHIMNFYFVHFPCLPWYLSYCNLLLKINTMENIMIFAIVWTFLLKQDINQEMEDWNEKTFPSVMVNRLPVHLNVLGTLPHLNLGHFASMIIIIPPGRPAWREPTPQAPMCPQRVRHGSDQPNASLALIYICRWICNDKKLYNICHCIYMLWSPNAWCNCLSTLCPPLPSLPSCLSFACFAKVLSMRLCHRGLGRGVGDRQ